MDSSPPSAQQVTLAQASAGARESAVARLLKEGRRASIVFGCALTVRVEAPGDIASGGIPAFIARPIKHLIAAFAGKTRQFNAGAGNTHIAGTADGFAALQPVDRYQLAFSQNLAVGQTGSAVVSAAVCTEGVHPGPASVKASLIAGLLPKRDGLAGMGVAHKARRRHSREENRPDCYMREVQVAGAPSFRKIERMEARRERPGIPSIARTLRLRNGTQSSLS